MAKQAPFWSILLLALAGAGLAQQQPEGGRTSGPAVGMNVTPSTVAQKLFEGRSGFVGGKSEATPNASSIAAGSPGVAGLAGAQSGEAPQGREAAAKTVY